MQSFTVLTRQHEVTQYSIDQEHISPQIVKSLTHLGLQSRFGGKVLIL